MRVLITGAGGFVGLNLVEALAGAGHTVIAVDLAAPIPEAGTIGGDVRWQQADARDSAAIACLLRDHRAECLVIAAAITADAEREASAAERIVAVNTLGAIAGLEAAVAAAVGRIVYLSSGAVYGEAAFANAPLDEVASPLAPTSLYAISKYAGERIALRYRETRGLDVVAARLGTVFGPWERETGVRDTLSPHWQIIEAARSGAGVVLPRACRRDWTYARDIADGLRCLIEAESVPGPLYHVSAGASFGLDEWCARLADRVPGFAWRIGEAAEPGERLIELHGARDRASLATERLAADLGWRAHHDLDSAFADYADWLGLGAQIIEPAGP